MKGVIAGVVVTGMGITDAVVMYPSVLEEDGVERAARRRSMTAITTYHRSDYTGGVLVAANLDKPWLEGVSVSIISPTMPSRAVFHRRCVEARVSPPAPPERRVLAYDERRGGSVGVENEGESQGGRGNDARTHARAPDDGR